LAVIENQPEKSMGTEIGYHTIVHRLVKNMLEENKDINGIYVTNSLTFSVASVLEELGLHSKIVLIGHEKTKINIEYLQKDVVQAIVYQDQYDEAVLAIEKIKDKILYNQMPDRDIVKLQTGILIKESV